MQYSNSDAVIFDSHAHYDDEAFAEDLPQLTKSMRQNGVTGVINCGTDYESSLKCIKLAHSYPGFFAAVGVHPENLYSNESLDTKRMQQLICDERVVAIGEIGLDYHWDTFSKEEQKKWFSDQIIFANDHNMPIIVHDREAHADTLEILKKLKPKGVVHCFSGSVETANEILKLGMYIGIGGVVTFKNARKTVEVAASVPLDRLLLETDAPYLSPVPMRGKRCRSDYIEYTASVIADIRGCDKKTILSASLSNIETLFKIPAGQNRRKTES